MNTPIANKELLTGLRLMAEDGWAVCKRTGRAIVGSNQRDNRRGRMNKEAQNQQILAFLKRGRFITQALAVHWFSIYRLSARIYDLKQAGHTIISERVRQNGKSFARYHLVRGGKKPQKGD